MGNTTKFLFADRFAVRLRITKIPFPKVIFKDHLLTLKFACPFFDAPTMVHVKDIWRCALGTRQGNMLTHN